jgi:hypothetical protein
VIFLVVLVCVVGLCVALVIGVAKNPGPSPAEIALGYEHAWDLGDFDVVYRMSGAELHEGLRKGDYVGAKRAAYRGEVRVHGAVEEAVAEAAHQQGDEAVVLTRLRRTDGTVVLHEVRLARRARAWEVVGYRLRPAPAL